ncbi:unnamed protein product, partial [Hymenolepis diminuta]
LIVEDLNVASILLTRAAESIKQYHVSFKRAIPVALELIKMEFGPLRSALFNFMESVYGPIARSTDVSFNGSSKILIQILCKELSDICMKMYEKDRHKNVVILNTLPLKWFRTHDRVTISVDVIV